MPMQVGQTMHAQTMHAHAHANMPAQCMHLQTCQPSASTCLCVNMLVLFEQEEPPKAKEVVGERPWLLTWFLLCSVASLTWTGNYVFLCLHAYESSLFAPLHSTSLHSTSPCVNLSACHYLQVLPLLAGRTSDHGIIHGLRNSSLLEIDWRFVD